MSGYNIRLIKLSDNKNALRTREIDGFAPSKPKIGERYIVYSGALDFPDNTGRCRFIETSPVASIDGNRFSTKSGTLYQIEELPSVK